MFVYILWQLINNPGHVGCMTLSLYHSAHLIEDFCKINWSHILKLVYIFSDYFPLYTFIHTAISDTALSEHINSHFFYTQQVFPYNCVKYFWNNTFSQNAYFLDFTLFTYYFFYTAYLHIYTYVQRILSIYYTCPFFWCTSSSSESSSSSFSSKVCRLSA